MKEGDSEDDGHLQDAYTLARCIYYSTQTYNDPCLELQERCPRVPDGCD